MTGPRVVPAGENVSLHGKRVLGDDAWDAREAERLRRESQGAALGPRVTDASPSERQETQVATPDESGGDADDSSPPDARLLPLRQLEAALRDDGSAALIDELLAAELERPEGKPRITALRLLLAAEQRLENPRAPLIAELRSHLGGD